MPDAFTMLGLDEPLPNAAVIAHLASQQCGILCLQQPLCILETGIQHIIGLTILEFWLTEAMYISTLSFCLQKRLEVQPRPACRKPSPGAPQTLQGPAWGC